MNRFRTARGPLLLTLWAFAPPIVLPTGGQDTISVSFGAVSGEYELIARSCDGEILSSAGVPFESGSVLVEVAGDDPGYRFSAFGSRTSASTAEAAATFPERTEIQSVVGGMLSLEGDRFGFGLGPVVSLEPEAQTHASLYLRIGDREGTYFQSDLYAPSALPGATGAFRAGLGFGGDRTNALLGLSVGRFYDPSTEDNVGPFADLSIGLTRNLEAIMGASWHPAEVHSDWGAGLGIRWRGGS